jgi:basic membrane protein A
MYKNFMKRTFALFLGGTLALAGFTGCGKGSKNYDDIATNEGYEFSDSSASSSSGDEVTGTSEKIAKEDIKVGVIHLTDPADGSGYTYTHDLGIQGMQDNLGLSDDQIVRKINVSDSDTNATREAILECIDEGCNIIFTTSWGYMETTADMAEEYPDIYFAHGTGYMSNGTGYFPFFYRISGASSTPTSSFIVSYISG